MVLRKATVDDQIPMAKVAAQAFFNDELFGDLIHPYRHLYPDDVHLFFLKRIRKGWADPANHLLVSTAPSAQGEGEEVAAWIQWTRKRADAHNDEHPADHTELEDQLPENRAASKDEEDVLERSYPCYADIEWTGHRAECWDITWLCTANAHQGKGHGKALVQWGTARAVEDGVTCSVIAAYGKDGFYNKQGLNVPSGTANDGEGNPLKGKLKGGQFWWKEDHLRE